MTLDEYLVQLKWRLERGIATPAAEAVAPLFAAVVQRLVAILETWAAASEVDPAELVVGDLDWRAFVRRFLQRWIVPQAPALALVLSDLAPALVGTGAFWVLLDELGKIEEVGAVYWAHWGPRLTSEACAITEWWRYVFGYAIAALMYVYLVEAPFLPGDEPPTTERLENTVVVFPKLEKPN